MLRVYIPGSFFICSFDGKLLQLYDVYGALLKDYIYMGNRLIAEYDHVGHGQYSTTLRTRSARHAS